MDANHFDQIVRSLSARGSRRGVLGLLAALPLLGSLTALLSPDTSVAKKRRKRHKKPHHHRKHTGNRAGKKKKRRCNPDSRATTCAGTCGSVKNTCKKSVDCGSCACDPPCPICQICQESPGAPGACVPDSAKLGDACGEPGQFCQADGACSCVAASCDPCAACQDGACSAPCGGNGCCDAGTCNPGNSADACGEGGASCRVCSNPTPICDGASCVNCSANADCLAANKGDLCCAGQCVTGICCTDAECLPTGNSCVGHHCGCGGDEFCSGGTPDCCGDPGDCTSILTDRDNCGGCGEACAEFERCQAGVCICDVCEVGCQFTSVQTAIDAADAGDTIYICPGTFDPIIIDKDVTLIGAGSSNGGTTLDAGDTTRVVLGNGNLSVVLQGLHMTRGRIGSSTARGGGVFIAEGALTLIACRISASLSGYGGGVAINTGLLTLTDCTVDGNFGEGGGAFITVGVTATLNNCTITGNNTSFDFGGGILNAGNLTINDTTIAGNTAKFMGGGISNESSGQVTLNNSSVSGNMAQFGGGILNDGMLTLHNSGVADNEAVFPVPEPDGLGGGGILNRSGATLTLDNSSVTSNTTNQLGGGIANTGTVTLQNGSTVTDNDPDDCVGPGTYNGSGCGP